MLPKKTTIHLSTMSSLMQRRQVFDLILSKKILSFSNIASVPLIHVQTYTCQRAIDNISNLAPPSSQGTVQSKSTVRSPIGRSDFWPQWYANSRVSACPGGGEHTARPLDESFPHLSLYITLFAFWTCRFLLCLQGKMSLCAICSTVSGSALVDITMVVVFPLFQNI